MGYPKQTQQKKNKKKAREGNGGHWSIMHQTLSTGLVDDVQMIDEHRVVEWENEKKLSKLI